MKSSASSIINNHEHSEHKVFLICFPSRDMEKNFLKKQIEFWKNYNNKLTVAFLCRTNNEKNNLSDNFDKSISVSTIHKSKGLEYDIVYIFGTDKENWKNEKNEEERRFLLIF